MNRRRFILAAPALALTLLVTPVADAQPAASDTSQTWLDQVTIPQLQAQFSRGQLTSVSLTKQYLQRIKRYDGRLGAVLEVNPEALRDASASDRIRREKGPRSALEGVPVLLKDNIDTKAQGATAGSRAMLRSRPDDAGIVTRLRAAGAIIIGKANLSEWANFRSENSNGGWSAVGGITRNPYNTAHSACGSSSGSAVGVAASFAQVAIGTETNGSIVCPAGTNGVVGLKPTRGLVSQDGIIPISAEQDTAGPIARSVIDAAITLGVLQGKANPNDGTVTMPAGQPSNYFPALEATALRGKRIGVWELTTDSPQTDAITQQAVAALVKAGATPVPVQLPYTDVVGSNGYEALKSEFKRDLNAYLAKTPGKHPRTLAELIEFNRRDKVELKYFDQNIFEMSQALPAAGSPQHLAARKAALEAATKSLNETLTNYRLDAIMAPTNSPAWLIQLGKGDDFKFGSAGVAAVAGYPNMTVPAGFSDGLPVGMSFMGARWNDAGVLSIGYAFQQATNVRHAPRLVG